jgi:hypothetical protein
MIVTFISIHFVIICDVLLWRTYETHPALSLKSGCDSWVTNKVSGVIIELQSPPSHLGDADHQE